MDRLSQRKGRKSPSQGKLGHIYAGFSYNIASVIKSNTNLERNGYSYKTPKKRHSNDKTKVLLLLQFIAVNKMGKNL